MAPFFDREPARCLDGSKLKTIYIVRVDRLEDRDGCDEAAPYVTLFHGIQGLRRLSLVPVDG
jgi:hypothetical protein